MITKITSAATAVLFVAAALMGPAFAYAQSTATMPALYNSSGVQVNSGNTSPLSAGTYYLAPGAQTNMAVQYYGNGTFYNPTTGLYGGSSSFDPNGTAGVSLGYSSAVTTPNTAPGLPDTGAGGMAAITWMTLIASAAVAVAGIVYLARGARHPALNSMN